MSRFPATPTFRRPGPGSPGRFVRPACSRRSCRRRRAARHARRASGRGELRPPFHFAMQTDFSTTLRTHRCGALRAAHVGQRVRLGGWVHRARNLGGLVFVDLRDLERHRADVVRPDDAPPRRSATGGRARQGVGGADRGRPSSRARRRCRMPRLATGDVEVRATSLRVVGPAVTPAIPVARGKGEKLPAEELRLRHRYLDLRRPELQDNLMLRHRLLQATRRYLSERGFLETRDPDSHEADAGGRARLPRAEPRAPGRVLRAAAVAADLQAAVHGVRVRPLLPDRPLLSRRGSARRSAARVHADRHRGVVRRAATTSSLSPRG